LSVIQSVAELERTNRPGVLCMIIRSNGSTPRKPGSKMLVLPDGSFEGTVGGGEVENRVVQEALQAMADGKPRLLEYQMTDPGRGDPGVCGGQVQVYVEPIRPKPTIVIIGAGHVGKAVAELAHWLGYRVVVNDDRPELCTPESIPGADQYIPSEMADLPSQLEITPWSYLVLTTRGVQVDVKGLPALLDYPAAYIGVIGSKRRWEVTRQQLLEMGVPDASLSRIRSPIGLELNAETPQEIAISILAEIIMLREGGDGRVMSVNKIQSSSSDQ